MSDARLWDSDHPYYMTPGNYFSKNCHTKWESLDLFLAEFGEADIDYNLVVRWDWLEGRGWGLADYNGSDTDRIARLMIQMVHQRKAILASHEIKVCRNDEPSAREYLSRHATRLSENWHPITKNESATKKEPVNSTVNSDGAQGDEAEKSQ